MALEEKVIERRHDEVLGAMKSVASAVKALQPKEDTELKKLFTENTNAINKFLQTSQTPKVELNQQEVVASLKEISAIMKGIDTRLQVLENKEARPLPTKLKAERNNYTKEIEYVTIEYKK